MPFWLDHSRSVVKKIAKHDLGNDLSENSLSFLQQTWSDRAKKACDGDITEENRPDQVIVKSNGQLQQHDGGDDSSSGEDDDDEALFIRKRAEMERQEEIRKKNAAAVAAAHRAEHKEEIAQLEPERKKQKATEGLFQASALVASNKNFDTTTPDLATLKEDAALNVKHEIIRPSETEIETKREQGIGEDDLGSDVDDGSLGGSDISDAGIESDAFVRDIIYTRYDKVHRNKNRWKCDFREAIAKLGPREYIISKFKSDLMF
eukprot:CAMPEP_0114982496 /NCGR_PEP_ID=MMETSP0216-20121206/6153_1 /TAXON_ID=223996 /ORGANISM="Protocruzia adherens, Strain Boccale" /LENGTH=261 /DNA_ID=CAMNT_0002344327 /DNA_START=3148 /DNA_END=3933 /DNA_ORIENTATION=-